MSTAGIQSTRGDIYEILVACYWALIVLSDPSYQWIEINSTTYEVDDVVIGKSNGSVICCQCKKNQTGCRAWSIADLADELNKAFRDLTKSQEIEVRFYSRNDFGALARLHESSVTYGGEAEYLANLTQEHKKTNGDLDARITAAEISNLSTYEFLRRTSFETSPDFQHMETLLHERLRYMASNSNAAFYALYNRLHKLSGRTGGDDPHASTQHRLTKEDLKKIFHDAGAMLYSASL